MELHRIIANTEAALAALSAALAAAGLLLCAVSYFGFFLFLQNADSAISPQIDSAEAALGNAQAVVFSVSQSAEPAAGAIASAGSALAAYSSASRNISDSLSDISKVPPFSLDARIASSAASMRQASTYFADAAASVNSSAVSAASAAAAVKKASSDLEAARAALGASKKSFKDAIGSLHLASLAGFFALSALFSSVMMLAASVLLTHYPLIFGGKDAEGARKK
jgi:hypothetical protein